MKDPQTPEELRSRLCELEEERRRLLALVAEQEAGDSNADDYAAPTIEELRRMLAERTVQLEAANKELVAFTYAAAHDMRAPLRAIDGFARVLVEDHSEQLDDAGRTFLSRIHGASATLGRIIDGLLILSRATSCDIERTSVNLGELAEGVLAELRQRHPERDVVVQLDDDLVVSADVELMRRVMENLLGNAWKFSSRMPRARIEVGQEKEASGTVFFVRDSGVGFDPSRADRLFSPFQRLHPKAEYEGSGLGLATVQRAIARHGGRVWAESTPGEGACFYFTLGG